MLGFLVATTELSRLIDADPSFFMLHRFIQSKSVVWLNLHKFSNVCIKAAFPQNKS